MNKVLELQQRAQSVREQHQNDTEEKLEKGIKQIFSDTESSLTERAKIFSKSIDNMSMSVEQHLSKAEAQIINLIREQQQQITAEKQQAFNEILNVQKQEMTQFKASLNAWKQEMMQEMMQVKASLSEFNDLSRQTANQVTIKSELLKSNIGVISVFCITLISSICLGYVSSSKYNDIKEMQKKVDYLKSQGGSMNIQKCGTEKNWKWCVQIDPTAAQFNNNMKIVQETN